METRGEDVFPLPLSMAHDDAFASRVAELKMTANETEDVFEALHRRRREGSKPNARSDGLKIGLVVEGGACAASSARGARRVVREWLLGLFRRGVRIERRGDESDVLSRQSTRGHPSVRGGSVRRGVFGSQPARLETHDGYSRGDIDLVRPLVRLGRRSRGCSRGYNARERSRRRRWRTSERSRRRWRRQRTKRTPSTPSIRR